MSGDAGVRIAKYSLATPCGWEMIKSFSGKGSPAAWANESSSNW
jgi:hypothetical protein